MSEIFIKILNMSIGAGWLILAAILIRFILRKAPKWCVCLLWGLVALKLIIPFSPESDLSLIPSNEVIPENITTQIHPQIHSGISYINSVVNPVIEAELSPRIEDSVNPLQAVTGIASVVWCIGMISCLVYATVSYFVLKAKVRISKPVKENIYACDEVKSPFILGMFRPMIYVPSGISNEVLVYVVAHEKAHLKRGDQFWKPVGFIILSVYWFNPLCWIAYILLCRDIEAACDEKVIKGKDGDYISSYSRALLDCSIQRKIIAICPLSFGETNVRRRIKGILNYKRPALWIIIISLIVCLIVAVCFLTKKKADNEPNTLDKAEISDLKNNLHTGGMLSEDLIAVGGETGAENADAAGDVATAEETDQDLKLSFHPYGYTGYMDELTMYEGMDEFCGCDYDGDGKFDRIYRIADTGSQMAEYRIEFGNGAKLYDKDVSEAAFPHVYAVDLDKDGYKEIVITYTVRPADREAFTWFSLFDCVDPRTYTRARLFESDWGMSCITVNLNKTGLRTASYSVAETGFEGELTFDRYYDLYDDDMMDECWDFYKSMDYTLHEPIAGVDIDEAASCLHCFAYAVSDTSYYLTFDVVFENGEYRIKNMMEGPIDHHSEPTFKDESARTIKEAETIEMPFTYSGINGKIVAEIPQDAVSGGDVAKVIIKDDKDNWIFKTELGRPHVGWHAYYIYHDQDTDYLISYLPYSDQGQVCCRLEVYEFDEEGKLSIADIRESGTPGEIASFNEYAKGYLEKSQLLISTLDGVITTGIAAAE